MNCKPVTTAASVYAVMPRVWQRQRPAIERFQTGQFTRSHSIYGNICTQQWHAACTHTSAFGHWQCQFDKFSFFGYANFCLAIAIRKCTTVIAAQLYCMCSMHFCLITRSIYAKLHPARLCTMRAACARLVRVCDVLWVFDTCISCAWHFRMTLVFFFYIINVLYVFLSFFHVVHFHPCVSP